MFVWGEKARPAEVGERGKREHVAGQNARIILNFGRCDRLEGFRRLDRMGVLSFVSKLFAVETSSDVSILIVDDDPMMRLLCKTRLIQDGFVVETASSGIEGLAMARARSYRVILLDLYMPEYTGLDFLRDAGDLLRSTPVIVLSAAEKAAIAERCLDLGATRFLIKPVPVRVLSAEVQRVLAS